VNSVEIAKQENCPYQEMSAIGRCYVMKRLSVLLLILDSLEQSQVS
jgi:hypothetical protein